MCDSSDIVRSAVEADARIHIKLNQLYAIW